MTFRIAKNGINKPNYRMRWNELERTVPDCGSEDREGLPLDALSDCSCRSS
jgi:hypothetical protein